MLNVQKLNGEVKNGLIGYEEVKKLVFCPLNRPIEPAHVNELYNVILKEGYDQDIVFKSGEAIVNPLNNHIIDWQHRIKAYLKAIENNKLNPNAKLRVVFEPHDSMKDEVEAIIAYNSKSSNWKLDTYINSHIEHEKLNDCCGDFTKLDNFAKTHILCYDDKNMRPKYTYAATIIKGSRQREDLRKGIWSVTDDELKFGDTIHNELVQIRARYEMPMIGPDIEGMASEWRKNRDSIDLEQFLKYKPRVKHLKMKKTTAEEWRTIFRDFQDDMKEREMRKLKQTA